MSRFRIVLWFSFDFLWFFHDVSHESLRNSDPGRNFVFSYSIECTGCNICNVFFWKSVWTKWTALEQRPQTNFFVLAHVSSASTKHCVIAIAIVIVVAILIVCQPSPAQRRRPEAMVTVTDLGWSLSLVGPAQPSGDGRSRWSPHRRNRHSKIPLSASTVWRQVFFKLKVKWKKEKQKHVKTTNITWKPLCFSTNPQEQTNLTCCTFILKAIGFSVRFWPDSLNSLAVRVPQKSSRRVSIPPTPDPLLSSSPAVARTRFIVKPMDF